MCASSPNWVRLTQITTIRDFSTSDFSTFWLGQWCEQVPDICGQTGHPWRVTGFLGQLNRDVQFGPKVGQIGIKWDKYHTFQHQTQNVLKTGFKNSHVFVPFDVYLTHFGAKSDKREIHSHKQHSVQNKGENKTNETFNAFHNQFRFC